MGRRGPAPKPRELREAQGTPGHRPLPAPVLVGERVASEAPPAPPGLGERATVVWNELAQMVTDAQMLTVSDLAVLEGLAVQIARARQAREALDGQPLAVEGAQSQWIVNPLVRVERDAWTLVLKIAREFGMTPSARASLGLTMTQGRSLAFDLQQRLGQVADVPMSVTVEEPAEPKKAPAKKKPTARRRKPAAAAGAEA